MQLMNNRYTRQNGMKTTYNQLQAPLGSTKLPLKPPSPIRIKTKPLTTCRVTTAD